MKKLIKNEYNILKIGKDYFDDIGFSTYRLDIQMNPCFISNNYGSWVFIDIIFTDLILSSLNEFQNNICFNCTRCINSCPTHAILKDSIINASKCISYLTIEYKGIIPNKLKLHMGNHIFGCDECQLICPYNKIKKKLTTILKFLPNKKESDDINFILNSTGEEFNTKHKYFVIKRAGYNSMIRIRNCLIVIGNLSL